MAARKSTLTIEVSKATILRVLAVFLGLGAIVQLRSLIFYLLFALLFAVALSPLIGWLQIKGLKRGSALALALILFVGGIFSLAAIIIVSFVDTVSSFASELPQYVESFRQYDLTKDYVDDALEAIETIDYNTVVQNGISSGSTLLSGASKAFEAVLFTFFFTVYMLLEKDYLLRVVHSIIPRSWSRRSKDLQQEFVEVVGNYIRGQLLTSFLMGVVSYIIFRTLGIPNALALGVIAGMTDVIPVIGGLLGLIPATLVALSISPTAAILTIVLVQTYSTLSNYFVRPRIFGNALDMSPFIVTVATMIGLLLFGIPGIIFALPAAAMFGYILTKYYGVPLIDEDHEAHSRRAKKADNATQ